MNKSSTGEWIKKAKQIHGNKYDYSKVEYIGAKTKVCIICPKHGEFWQTPDNHVSKKQNCPKCIGRIVTSKDKFIEESNKKHDNAYDYSKTDYVNSSTKVCIICPKHGEFWQTPNHHLNGSGCPKCVGKNKSTETFVNEAKNIHDGKYTYEKTNYVTMKKNVIITCPIHGDFKQTPDNHLHGKGCPKCNESRLEKFTRQILEDKKIDYEYQKRFKWLGKQSFDFFIPNFNIAIECQGIQHYQPVDFANKGKKWAETLYEKTVKRDNKKAQMANDNGIKILYINQENKKDFIKILNKWVK